MPARKDYAEYGEDFLGSKYPFADQATLTNGQMVWPKDVLIDAIIHIPDAGPRFYISEVRISSTELKIWVGDASRPRLASGSLSRSDLQEDMELQTERRSSAGLLIASPQGWQSLLAWPLGVHTFKLTQTELCAAVCWPLPNSGVNGIVLDDGSLVANEVWLVGGDGVVLEVQDRLSWKPPYNQVPVIRVHAWGDPLSRYYDLVRQKLSSKSWKRYLRQITFKHRCQTQVVTGAGHIGSSCAVLQVDPYRYPDTALQVRSTGEALEISLQSGK